MNKKFISLLLAVGMAASLLSGCGSTSGSGAKSASGDELAQIRKKGEIVFATEGTWSPWTYHDKSDKLVGFDIEIARAAAKKLGVKATFVEGKWDGLLAGLEAGRYDSMANGVEVTAERKEMQGRFTHMFKPGNKWMVEQVQKEVNKNWDELLKLCSEIKR